MAVQAVTIVRWFARIIGTLLFLGLLTFAIGEEWSNPMKLLQVKFVELSAMELIELVGILLIMTGLLIGWKWELSGGLMILAGVGIFWIIELIVNHSLHPGWPFIVLAIPGMSYLYCSLWKKQAIGSVDKE